MSEIQVVRSKPSIHRRNELWKRNDALLRQLRALHGGEQAVEVQGIARATASKIIDTYWSRDRERGPLDVELVQAAILARDKLRDAYTAHAAHERRRQQLKATLPGELRQSHQDRPPESDTSPAPKTHGRARAGSKRLDELEASRATDLDEAEPRSRELRDALDALTEAFEKATTAARCGFSWQDDELEAALEFAKQGERLLPIEPWDVATQIYRHFGPTIDRDGIRDERVVLDRREDALAYTLFARAVLSNDAADDLIGEALRGQENDELRSRVSTTSMYCSRTVHDFVSLLVWPSLEGGRREEGAIGREEAQRRTILDSDSRLERFIVVGETALDAATSQGSRDEPRSQEAKWKVCRAIDYHVMILRALVDLVAVESGALLSRRTVLARCLEMGSEFSAKTAGRHWLKIRSQVTQVGRGRCMELVGAAETRPVLRLLPGKIGTLKKHAAEAEAAAREARGE